MKPGAKIAVFSDGKDRAAASLAVQDALDTTQALRALGFDVIFIDCNSTDAEDFRPLFEDDFDLVYVAGTAPFASREGVLGFNPLAFIGSPVMARIGDPLYHGRFAHTLSQFQKPVTVSAKDRNLADYLELSGVEHSGVGYCAGRYDRRDYPGEKASLGLEKRDIPYLFVASLVQTKPFTDFVDQCLPSRWGVLGALTDALEREPVVPAWRVAESLYNAEAPDLLCHRGQGRFLLEVASRLAANRIRIRMIRLLGPHPGLIIVNQDAGALDLPDNSRARILPAQSVTQVEALRFRARVSVCPLAHLCVGAVSERVYRSMAAGAVVLSPWSPALDHHFSAGAHYLSFDRDFSGFTDHLTDALQATAAARDIADAGRQRAEAEFSSEIATRRMLAV